MLFLASMDDKDAAYIGGVFALGRLSSGCRFETVKNGKIDVFCTLGQSESCFLTAQAYKICASCHAVSGAFAQDSRRRTYAPYLSSPASGDGAALWPALARSIVAARSRKRSKGGYIAHLQ